MMPCERCGRTFGGLFGFDRHLNRVKDRCRTDRQLRARGMTQRPDGVWVRASSFYRQQRLIPGRPGRPRNRAKKLRGPSRRGVQAHRRGIALPGQSELPGLLIEEAA